MLSVCRKYDRIVDENVSGNCLLAGLQECQTSIELETIYLRF